MPEPLTIIGIGSPYGDDRLGWLTVDEIERESGQALRCIKLDRPGPMLLRHFAGLDDVVLIDAINDDGNCPVKQLQIDELPLAEVRNSTHSFELSQTLALGQSLGLLPERLRLFGVPMSRLPASSQLEVETEQLEIRAHEAAVAIAKQLDNMAPRGQ
ncbi:MAG: hydrogenase maturation protease [Thiotrichales bacterium]